MQPNPIIILEGADGTGKTTLARLLETKYGFRYHHEGPPPKGVDLLRYYAHIFYTACKETQPVVFDRLHVGEAVYGPILRGSIYGMAEIKLMNRLILAAGANVTWCNVDIGVAYINWKNRLQSELFKDEKLFVQVYEKYVQLFKDPLLDYAGLFNYTQISAELAAEALDTLVKEFVTKALPVGVIGHPNARFLFVGDIANQEVLDLPFFDLGNSSLYINNALEAAGYKENEIALCNARTLDGRVWDGIEEAASRFPCVVALGTQAESVLWRLNLGTALKAIPHPAYWKRFQSSGTGEYVEMLASIRRGFYAASAAS